MISSGTPSRINTCMVLALCGNLVLLTLNLVHGKPCGKGKKEKTSKQSPSFIHELQFFLAKHPVQLNYKAVPVKVPLSASAALCRKTTKDLDVGRVLSAPDPEPDADAPPGSELSSRCPFRTTTNERPSVSDGPGASGSDPTVEIRFPSLCRRFLSFWNHGVFFGRAESKDKSSSETWRIGTGLLTLGCPISQ